MPEVKSDFRRICSTTRIPLNWL